MPRLIVRLSKDVRTKIRDRARRYGRSTEAEIRDILRNAVIAENAPSQGLGTRIRARFARIGLDRDIP